MKFLYVITLISLYLSIKKFSLFIRCLNLVIGAREGKYFDLACKTLNINKTHS